MNCGRPSMSFSVLLFYTILYWARHLGSKLCSKICIGYKTNWTFLCYSYNCISLQPVHQPTNPLNSHMHTINTRYNNNLHVPPAKLAVYQRGVYYSWIKIFNHLPSTIKNLSDNKKKFQLALRKFLLYNSFYSLEEYYST